MAYTMRKIQDLERDAEWEMRKIRIVTRIEWPLPTQGEREHGFRFMQQREQNFAVWMLPEGLEIRIIPLNDDAEFPPLVGLGDQDSWVEFSSDADARSVTSEGSWCMAGGSDMDVCSVKSEDSWCAAGKTVNDRIKPSRTSTLDFKAALSKPSAPPQSITHRRARKDGSVVIVQAMWREDVVAVEEQQRLERIGEDDDQTLDPTATTFDMQQYKWHARQVGAMRKARSHVMVAPPYHPTQILPSCHAHEIMMNYDWGI